MFRHMGMLLRLGPVKPHLHRSSFRTTSLSPDHTSVTAQTLTSTNPSGSASSRIVSSVMSVGIFADFLGQETQRTAVGRSFERYALSSFASSALLAEKRCTRSVLLEMRETNLTPSG